jgi:hypothetical protein
MHTDKQEDNAGSAELCINLLLPLCSRDDLAVEPTSYVGLTFEATQMLIKFITQDFVFVSIAVEEFEIFC